MFTRDALYTKVDGKYGEPLAELVLKSKNQQFLDHMYETIKAFYLNEDKVTFDLNKIDQEQMSLLHWAAACNQKNAILELLAANARVDGLGSPQTQQPLSYKPTPFHSLMYIQGPDKRVGTPLLYALELGHYDVAKVLVESGADVNAVCINNSNDLIFKCIVNPSLPNTALNIVAKSDNLLDLIIYLVGKGAIVNPADKSKNPLFTSIWYDAPKVNEYLISHGADVNAASYATSWISNGTPLLTAIYENSIKNVEILLRHGAEVEPKNVNVYSPLSLAAFLLDQNDRSDIMALLLNHGANIEKKYNDKTPLESSISTWKLKQVEILLKHYFAKLTTEKSILAQYEQLFED